MLKNENKVSNTSAIKKVDEHFVASLLKNNNFTLTNDQRVVIREIIEDLKKDGLMYRMLQGDVGTGKTLVAALALAANYSASYQGVLMAPTDILARQHYSFLKNFYGNSGIKIELLVSSLSTKQKKEIVDKLRSGEIDVVVGTHALIQKGVEYHKLGLAIIDEQHRFGVNQREKLVEKGEKPGTVVSQLPNDGSWVDTYSRVSAVIAYPETTTDDMVYGIFTEELPEYAYALQIKLEVITPEEERYQIASIMHPGGLLTIPYLVPRNSILVLSIYDKEAIRRSVQ
jgi:hypothetical protein